MCGLVGVAGEVNITAEKAFRNLLILDSLRGEDSTGIASIKKVDGNVLVAKALGDPFQLFDTKVFDRAVRGTSKAILGHNRYATTGAVTARNAHPFEFNSLVGVHNGTLTNKWSLEDHKDFSVDSENLYHHIEKKGLRNAMDVANGAWALVWWDKIEETLNFLRNKERPLFFCYNESNTSLFWASEEWMLQIALSRVGIKHGKIAMFDEDVHHSIYIDDKAQMFKPNLRSMQKEEKKVWSYQPTVVQQQQQPKKEESVLKKSQGVSQLASQAPYINAKGVRLETLALVTDIHGNDFISCFDKSKPHHAIRLYHRRTDTISNFIGEDIYGDINSHVTTPDGSDYYKVSPWSVRVAFPEFEETSIADNLYPTSSGQFLTLEEWEKVHPTCAWCTVDLDPKDTNRFTVDNECVCPICATDRQVEAYVNFK